MKLKTIGSGIYEGLERPGTYWARSTINHCHTARRLATCRVAEG